MKSYQQFFAELKRRKVFRVMAVYGVVAFAIIEAADVIFPRIALPDWTVTLVVWLALFGLPIAIVLAWAFESTPDAMKRTEEATPDELAVLIAAPASQRIPAGLIALAGMAALLFGAWWAGTRTATHPVAPAAESSTADVRLAFTDLAEDSRPSIAVLPFADMSSTQEQEHFSDGMTEEILKNPLEGGGALGRLSESVLALCLRPTGKPTSSRFNLPTESGSRNAS